MKHPARPSPSVFEALESRLFFSIIPAAVVSQIAEPNKVHSVGDTPPVVTGTGLTGEFFGGNNFQTPVVVRTDTVINFRWTSGKPDQDIPKGTFTARWTGQIQPTTTGSYTFYTNSDSGTRVTVNGIVLFDNLAGKKPSVQSGTIVLVAGENYDVEVEYASRKGSVPRVQFLWSTDTVKKQLVPKAVLFADTTVALPSSALSGVYYQGRDFGNEIMARSDPAINFNWGTGSPDLAIPPHTPFSVRWLGQITAPTAGLYTFKSVADDGVRLWVNGQLIIDNFKLDNGHPHLGTIMLAPGVYDLREDYFEDGTGRDSARLLWAAPGQHKYAYVSFTQPVLAPPAAVTASATIDGFVDNVQWTASPNASSYLVERSPDGSTGWISLATTSGTTISENGLAPGIYYYRVTAVNAAGSSAPSNVVRVATPPDSPLGVVATPVSATEIDLHWNDVNRESGFNIFESLTGPANWHGMQIASTATGVTSLRVAGLSPGTTYYFAVQTTSTDAGSSLLSNIVNGTTGPANPSYASLTTVYGLTGNGKVYSIDTTNGAVAQIGTLSFGTNASGRDPYSSNFYYVSTGTSTVSINAWNPNDGSNTVSSASLPLSGPVAEAAFATDGTFFLATDIGDLYAYNVDNGSFTLRGNIHAHGVTLNTGNGDLAFAPDGTMFIETSSELYSVPRSSIDAGTGAGSIITATDIGATGPNNLQLAFGQNGVLFGTDANGQLYSIDPATAASTPIGAPSGINMGDLASVPLYPDLTINQTSSSFLRGTNGTYTLTAANTGPDTTVGPITMIDTLPAGVTYVSGSGTGWTFNVNGQTVTMVYSQNVAAGANPPVVTLNVAVGPSATNTVTNAVTLSTTVFETNTANNSSSLDTSVTG